MNQAVRLEVTSAVTSKGQTTIPKEVRDALGITEGTPLRWVLSDGVLTVRAKTRRLEDFVPMAPPNGRQATVEDMNEAIAQAVTEKMRRADP